MARIRLRAVGRPNEHGIAVPTRISAIDASWLRSVGPIAVQIVTRLNLMATDREGEEDPSFASYGVQNTSTVPLISTNSGGEYTVDEVLTIFGDGLTQKVLLALLGCTYSAGSAAAALMLFLEPNV